MRARLVPLLLAAPALAQPALPPAGDAPTATISILDKGSGAVSRVTVAPGQRFRAGKLSGVMRTCERTPPGERRQTAAFLELDVTPRATADGRPARPVRVFSGWMFAESPSLNPLRHAAYDVWLSACTILEPAPAPASDPGSVSRTASKPRQSAPSASASPRSER